MKRFKPAIICLGILLAPMLIFAQATSLNKDALVAVASTYNWSGTYAGFNLGAVKHSMNITDNQAVTFNATIQEATNPSFIGGLQLGYRRQLNQASASGVWGLELSTDFAHAKAQHFYGSPYALYQLNSRHQLKNATLGELMLGIAADRSLLFMATGVSWYSVSGNVINQDGIPFFNQFSVSKQAFAPALGGGAEYAINDKISTRLKVDVLFASSFSTVDNVGNTYSLVNTIVLGTIGINYRFA